ncbi:helix-turn-helix domain-containing protein [Pseudomonas trivialis]|uniref:HTH cro/C1-type domain-containing protein n=1 Tax=Pseudomonas trivialis TaxID=200450 RepID=A0A0R2ZKL4_9PSED|nr:helix-turn-helix transcriptional regulator [Pseudomonas trivialis]KRP61288.1 hypothetical protein TU79_07945 [Pseudomonas trivialis]SDT01614.1 hypothetical protein SAMN04490205_4436 [Pseudomonas trivialis]
MKEIGRRLKQERHRMGLTLQRLAEIGGVTVAEQRRYELSEAMPAADYLAALASHGLDVVYIVTGKKQAVVKMSWEEAQALLDSRAISGDLFQNDADEEIYFKVSRPSEV